MKKLLALAAALLTLAACNPKPQPQPEEYFSFDANGVHYDYPQEKGTSLFTGDWKTLGAGSSSQTVGYIISGNSRKDMTARGIFEFTITQNGNQIPSQDTVLLDDVQGYVSIYDFKTMSNNYYSNTQQTGRIIFSKRSSSKLEGTFEFDAKQQYDGTILHITNGKFCIIPNP